MSRVEGTWHADGCVLTGYEDAAHEHGTRAGCANDESHTLPLRRRRGSAARAQGRLAKGQVRTSRAPPPDACWMIARGAAWIDDSGNFG
eukprot:5545545-Prymnesium_polylepis.1